MTCGCVQDPGQVRGRVPSPAGCRFCTETRVWWAPHKSCYVFRCSNPVMLTDPPEWAFGNTRRATVGDTPKGAVIEDADWIAVRSCFCRCEKCPHFIGLPQINAEKT